MVPVISVLYLDITNFTVLSSIITPDTLINLLNTIFTKFDRICDEHEIEKVDIYLRFTTFFNDGSKCIRTFIKTLKDINDRRCIYCQSIGVFGGWFTRTRSFISLPGRLKNASSNAPTS